MSAKIRWLGFFLKWLYVDSSMCNFECNNPCEIDEYLDIKNCPCKIAYLVNYY